MHITANAIGQSLRSTIFYTYKLHSELPHDAFVFNLVQDFKIQNIVGSCDVKFPIRLEGLAYSHGAFSSVSSRSLSWSLCVSLCVFNGNVIFPHY